MNRLLLFFLAHFSIFELVSYASGPQGIPAIENQPLPSGPLLNRAPSFSEWTVSYAYANQNTPNASKAPPALRLQILKVTKTNDIYHEEKVFNDGTKHESWHRGDMQFITDPVSKKVVLYDSSSFPNLGDAIAFNPDVYTDYSKFDFPALSWISSQSYRGIQKIKDVAYLVFQEKDGSTETNPDASSTFARIDPTTRLPVQVKNTHVTLTYQFGPSPQTVQTLPPEILALLNKRAEVIKKLTTRMPSY